MPSNYQPNVRDIIKDTVEQLDEEVHRADSERVPKAGACDPTELDYTALKACGTSTNLEALRAKFYIWMYVFDSTIPYSEIYSKTIKAKYAKMLV